MEPLDFLHFFPFLIIELIFVQCRKFGKYKKCEGKKHTLKVPLEMTIINILMIVFLYMRDKERGLCVYVFMEFPVCIFLLKDMILCHVLVTSFEVFGLCTQIMSSLIEGIT